MKTILIFPGQGSQTKGMASKILENYPASKDILERAGEILNYDLTKIIEEDRDNLLNRTLYTQPALYTVSAMYTEFIRSRELTWCAAAGHSLGEYSALYAAGAYSFEDGLRLVARRAALMDSINDDSLGMGAVLGLDSTQITSLIKDWDNLFIANLNSPEQTVVSGAKDAISALSERLKQEGKGRLIPLRVKGAFHSPYMKPVEDQFKTALDDCPINDASCQVFPNVMAAPATEGPVLKDSLLKQICGQVRWMETVVSLEKNGFEAFIEAGPGKVLTGLMKKSTNKIQPYPLFD